MLPTLPDWPPTKTALHRACQVISVVRKTAIDPLPNHLHHSLFPTPTGASSGPLPHLGEFSLDFASGVLTHTHNGITISTHRLDGLSPVGLFTALADELHEMEYEVALPMPDDLSDEPIVFDPAHGAALAEVMRRMFNAVAMLRAHCLGFQTPLVLWSHGFDLSTLWFATGQDEHTDPHMNFGFSPGTASHPEPYIYTYAYPVQTALRDALPDGFQWMPGWSTPGALMPYQVFATSGNPEQDIAQKLLALYRVGAVALRVSDE